MPACKFFFCRCCPRKRKKKKSAIAHWFFVVCSSYSTYRQAKIYPVGWYKQDWTMRVVQLQTTNISTRHWNMPMNWIKTVSPCTYL
jgi:hypothetical protein